MKKEQHNVISGFLHSTTNIYLGYNLNCCITETELYYKLTLDFAKEKREKSFGTIDEAMDFLHELMMSYTNSFRTWELLNIRLK